MSSNCSGVLVLLYTHTPHMHTHTHTHTPHAQTHHTHAHMHRHYTAIMYTCKCVPLVVWSMRRCLWAKRGAPWYWLRLCSFPLESFGLDIFTTANGSSAMFIDRRRGNAQTQCIHTPTCVHTLSVEFISGKPSYFCSWQWHIY